MNERKIDVTIKPFYQSPLFQSLIGVFAVVLGVYLTTKMSSQIKQPTQSENLIDENRSKFSFDADGNIIVKIYAYTDKYGSRWIENFDGNTTRTFGKNVGQGLYAVTLRGLRCGSINNFRSVVQIGEVSFRSLERSLTLGKCGTAEEIAVMKKLPQYVPLAALADHSDPNIGR